ncbi:MAG: zinc-ribbon domain containing protein [Dehalococcoidales bacterium]|jgi:CxxC-x17-CxxC domain-containing protein
MSFKDKTIQCSDCGVTFTFSAEDQEFFQSKGYTNEPKRCQSCRQARKNERGGGGNFSSARRMYPATCGSCGQTTEVPFQPRGDKPVYCSDCYRKIGR